MPKNMTNFMDPLQAEAEAREAMQRRFLVKPRPPVRPKRFLPAARSNPRAIFRPLPKLDTPAKLARELARYRRRFAPFQRQLAPALTRRGGNRITAQLVEFDWRLEGQRRWKRVIVPHYSGPVGRAVAYYRTTFQISRAMRAKGALFVRFKGVDYKAHVFVNDEYLGSHEGFFAPFEFEFTAVARSNANVLLVKVENDAPFRGTKAWTKTAQLDEGDKIYAGCGPGWDDPQMGWHHCPPGMGIYQDVMIESRLPVHVSDLFVRPLPEEPAAEAWIEIRNCLPESREIKFALSVFGQNFRQTVFCRRVFPVSAPPRPGINHYRVRFKMPRARRWTPETPWLYQLQVALSNGDARTRSFGMRSFRMDAKQKPYGRLFLNNREIRLRGANTMGFEQQCVMRKDFAQLRDDILLAKICHLNFLRITQRPVQEEVYGLCDELGLMTQTDLPLWGILRRNQFCEAVRQAEEMERLVRNHPCNVLVSFINEPSRHAQHQARASLALTRAELEKFFIAASQTVSLVNPDRIIKPVDGDYDPPAPGLPDNHTYPGWYGEGLHEPYWARLGELHKGYWLPVKPDWHYACGEFGMEGLDSVPFMKKFYPPDWLPKTCSARHRRLSDCAKALRRDSERRGEAEAVEWTPDRIVAAQTGPYHALWFDPFDHDGNRQRTPSAWVNASQAHQAWVTRLMTEAFRRDNRMNSSAICHFIDAWPAGWLKAIVSANREPKPAYFVYREALTPLMVNIRADRCAYFSGEEMLFEFWICNDTHCIPPRPMLRYQLEIEGLRSAGAAAGNGRDGARSSGIILAQQARARVEKCRSTFQGFLRLLAPAVTTRTRATLRLALDGIHNTAVVLDLFPRPPRLQPTAIIVRNYNARIDAAVRRGATAVFLNLPPGEHEIAGAKIQVAPCRISPRHFVSRAPGHPLVNDFRPDDFKFWYDPRRGYPTPLLETDFSAEGWTPILLSESNPPRFAAAEKRHGQGLIRICQLRLSGHPVARLLAWRMMSR